SNAVFPQIVLFLRSSDESRVRQRVAVVSARKEAARVLERILLEECERTEESRIENVGHALRRGRGQWLARLFVLVLCRLGLLQQSSLSWYICGDCASAVDHPEHFAHDRPRLVLHL